MSVGKISVEYGSREYVKYDYVAESVWQYSEALAAVSAWVASTEAATVQVQSSKAGDTPLNDMVQDLLGIDGIDLNAQTKSGNRSLMSYLGEQGFQGGGARAFAASDEPDAAFERSRVLQGKAFGL